MHEHRTVQRSSQIKVLVFYCRSASMIPKQHLFPFYILHITSGLAGHYLTQSGEFEVNYIYISWHKLSII